MKVRSTVLLATASLLIPMGLLLVAPEVSIARNVRGDRGPSLLARGDKNLSPEQREAKKAERAAKLQTALGLSDAQASQVAAIHAAYQPRFEALHTQAKALRDSGADRTAMQPIREQMQTLRAQLQGEIKAVLTPAQQAQFETLKNQRRGWGKEGRGEGRRGDRPAV